MIVANSVQRLRYFDGEYLRSYDFTDEQSYHIAMRRLMNMRLHLHGIVYGLDIVLDQDSVPVTGPFFYSISPGLAIDQTGREIIVTAPYSLTNVLTAPGLGPGDYEVWICYQETETSLPAAGYQDCNSGTQYTRWQETFQVQLKPVIGPSIATDCGGLRLGIVRLQMGPLGLGFGYPAQNIERNYVGIRAQRVIAPDEEKDTFDITALSLPPPPPQVPDLLPGYLDVRPSIFNRGNMIVRKNLVIGDDFVLNSSDPTGPNYSQNLPNFTPTPTGDLKITGDMFLNGNFYGYNPTAGQWYQMKQYIQSLSPTTLAASVFYPTPPQPVPGAFVPPYSITIPQSINLNSGVPPGIPNPTIVLSINEIDWQDPVDLNNYWNTNPTVQNIGFQVQLSGALFNGATNPPTLTFNIVITPGVHVGTNILLPITGVGVNYMLIFVP